MSAVMLPVIEQALAQARTLAAAVQLPRSKGRDPSGREFTFVRAPEYVRAARPILAQVGLSLRAMDETIGPEGLTTHWRLTSMQWGVTEEWAATTPLDPHAPPDLAASWARTHARTAALRALLWFDDGDDTPDPSERARPEKRDSRPDRNERGGWIKASKDEPWRDAKHEREALDRTTPPLRLEDAPFAPDPITPAPSDSSVLRHEEKGEATPGSPAPSPGGATHNQGAQQDNSPPPAPGASPGVPSNQAPSAERIPAAEGSAGPSASDAGPAPHTSGGTPADAGAARQEPSGESTASGFPSSPAEGAPSPSVGAPPAPARCELGNLCEWPRQPEEGATLCEEHHAAMRAERGQSPPEPGPCLNPEGEARCGTCEPCLGARAAGWAGVWKKGAEERGGEPPEGTCGACWATLDEGGRCPNRECPTRAPATPPSALPPAPRDPAEERKALAERWSFCKLRKANGKGAVWSCAACGELVEAGDRYREGLDPGKKHRGNKPVGRAHQACVDDLAAGRDPRAEVSA